MYRIITNVKYEKEANKVQTITFKAYRDFEAAFRQMIKKEAL